MKPKNLPRLWCALQGLLPLDACLAAQRGELAWPAEPAGSAPATDGSAKSQSNPPRGVSSGKERRR